MTHTSEDNHICIVGLGYVGLTLAVAMAEAGFQVSGVERNAAVAAIIRSGRALFSEEGLDAPLAKAVNEGRLKVLDDLPTVTI